ncbi:hypothetical protein BDV93DRAFT_520324 [Ceratobasidium sp. AG-I]|nr:hypothetical protein BDV93DRAFT_520324 [Ceratobasidium sp. AG-I]
MDEAKNEIDTKIRIKMTTLNMGGGGSSAAGGTPSPIGLGGLACTTLFVAPRGGLSGSRGPTPDPKNTITLDTMTCASRRDTL